MLLKQATSQQSLLGFSVYEMVLLQPPPTLLSKFQYEPPLHLEVQDLMAFMKKKLKVMKNILAKKLMQQEIQCERTVCPEEPVYGTEDFLFAAGCR